MTMGLVSVTIGTVGVTIGLVAVTIGTVGVAIGLVSVTMGAVGVTIGLVSVTIGAVGVTIGTVGVTISLVGVTIGLVVVTIGTVVGRSPSPAMDVVGVTMGLVRLTMSHIAAARFVGQKLSPLAPRNDALSPIARHDSPLLCYLPPGRATNRRNSRPTMALSAEPSRIPTLAVSLSKPSAGKASAAMKSDMVKPMPPSIATP